MRYLKQHEKFYKNINPIEEKSLQSKLELLKEVNNYTRAKGGYCSASNSQFFWRTQVYRNN